MSIDPGGDGQDEVAEDNGEVERVEVRGVGMRGRC